MRSILRKIQLWAIATIALALVGMFITSIVLSRWQPGHLSFLARTQVLQQEGAERAFNEGGPASLSRYLNRLNELFEAEHFLLNAAGYDLLTGEDRSAELAALPASGQPPTLFNGRMILASPKAQTATRLLILVSPPRGNFGPWPYFLWVLLVVVLLGYALALHIARPLNRLRAAVVEFGQGNLSTRIGSTRADEIGQLSRSFDEMAARIETLLSAERRLLQDVSHELRSPLARLGFAVELARSGDQPDRAFERISRDLDRISTLVGELLLLTRVEGDPVARIFEPISLDLMLAEIADDAMVEAEARGCSIRLEAEPDLTTQGEPELLRRAFENTLRNALRYGPEGSEITILASQDTQTHQMILKIQDKGNGVPDSALEAIFDPFYRVENDRSRASGGSGLGLAIARRAIQLHGGQIRAANTHPGLCITIELPGSPD